MTELFEKGESAVRGTVLTAEVAMLESGMSARNQSRLSGILGLRGLGENLIPSDRPFGNNLDLKIRPVRTCERLFQHNRL